MCDQALGARDWADASWDDCQAHLVAIQENQAASAAYDMGNGSYDQADAHNEAGFVLYSQANSLANVAQALYNNQDYDGCQAAAAEARDTYRDAREEFELARDSYLNALWSYDYALSLIE
jgi:hypothetical protein